MIVKSDACIYDFTIIFIYVATAKCRTGTYEVASQLQTEIKGKGAEALLVACYVATKLLRNFRWKPKTKD